MITIILAAGNNERFGGEHKSTLESRDGRTFLENQVDVMKPERLFFIAQREYYRDLHDLLFDVSYKCDVGTLYHGWLDEPTEGPLDTLWKARGYIESYLNSDDDAVVITYCDVLLPKNEYTGFLKACEGKNGIAVFESDDERFGDVPGKELKNSGFFYFWSGRFMLSMLEKTKIKVGMGIPDLVYSFPDPLLHRVDNVVDIGTPEDYEEWINA